MFDEWAILSMLQLELLVDRYIDFRNKTRPIGRDLSPATRQHLINCTKDYSRWLGRPARVSDLAPAMLNQYLSTAFVDRSPRTAKNRRTGLLVLLRFARRRKMTKHKARSVRPIICPAMDVDGFTPEQMQLLVAYASTLKGNIRLTGIPRSVWWTSLVLTQWNIGLRIGDFPRIEVAHFDAENGRLWAMEQKTKKCGWQTLFPSTARAIARCIAVDPSRKFIWPGIKSSCLSQGFRIVARKAGLKGSSQWVRRGASSAVDAQQPGQGWLFLRHSDPKVFNEFYRVKKICDQSPPRPPDIFAA